MKQEITIYPAETIEKKNKNNAKNIGINEENCDSFRKLIAEIMVEIIIKRSRNGRNRVHQDK